MWGARLGGPYGGAARSDGGMKITVFGAAGGEVTGSSYLVETPRAALLVECGMFSGEGQPAERNHPRALPIGADSIAAVLVTHAHLDHSGRLPLLAREGYRGRVYATAATAEIAALLLRDSAHIQEHDAERLNRRRARSGELPAEPLYTIRDVERIIERFAAVPYHEPVDVAPGVRAVFIEAGHILGSSSIQLIVDEDGVVKRVVFSGDLGPRETPIVRDFESFGSADVVFMESTYGDRDHRAFDESVDEFIAIVGEAAAGKGKILVPTFAVGRAQTLLALLGWTFRAGRIKPFPIFLDSPMAVEATGIYLRHPELFDENLAGYVLEWPPGGYLKTLKTTVSAEESKAINDHPGPCLVMAGSGMCTGGRILHHLKHNLWRPEAHVVIVGYQSPGTLGRQLVDGAKRVSVLGEEIAVKARVHTLGGFSSHAGQKELLAWFEALAPARPRLVLTHGGDRARVALAERIKERHGIEARLISEGESVEA